MKNYQQSVSEAMRELQTTREGINNAEATSRIQKYGLNKLEEGKKKSMAARVWDQLKDPMILVLIAAAIISGAFGEIADMVIILVVVALNAVLGIVQESKAEKAIEALQRMAAPHSKVRREGVVLQVKSEEIIPGDVVLLEAGDAVPADMRLIETASVKIEEAALTGESVPVEKHTDAIQPGHDEDVPLGDRANMAYMGTSVAYGRAEGIVTATGMNTEMGKIAGILAGTGDDEKTPLQKKLASLSKVLSAAVLIICVFVFIINVLRNGGFAGGHIFESLLIAISLAVAAIPEGLVVVVTVLLSIGVTRMSDRNAIIRRMTAVETLGCTQVICSDKTGTLTQNRMTVVDHFGDEDAIAKMMSCCTDVRRSTEGYAGDPTEIALVEYADKVYEGRSYVHHHRVAEAPFDSDRKMMSTLHSSDEGNIVQYTKGAPDEILMRCTSILQDGKMVPMTQAHREQVVAENKRMAQKALRVLAVAYRLHDELPGDLSPDSVEQTLVFTGLTGMIDPVRPEVVDAIVECKEAGVRAVMITGDHRDTAIAIAKELGILTEERQAITGAELSKMSDAEFEKRIHEISVYARVQPEHKVRIVNTWKKLGKITAMTGDGVNDAPALKAADIGVGMGITGTDVTKNVADMVLTDDNFASIVYAVEEGRRIYENIRKAIQFLLASNLAEVVAIFIATIVGWKLFAPIHILWINLITDTFPAMALGMEKAEPDAMKKQPRDPKESIFANGLGVDVIWQGVFVGLLTLWSFTIGNAQSHLIGMTMAFFTLSMCEIFHAINMRSRTKSLFQMKGHNKHLLGAMLLSFVLTLSVMYIPGLNTVFELAALSASNLFTSLGIALLIFPAVELVKVCKRSAGKIKAAS